MNLDSEHVVQDYLSKVTQRFQQQGFKVARSITYKNQVFTYSAKRTRFEADKYGYVTTFFIFARFRSLDFDSLKQFSALSFKYAKKASGIHPPLGLFYGIVCFPVAIVDTIENSTAEIVRKKDPPKHWAALEIPVVHCLENKTLYFCEVTPTWGYLYYDQLRQTIKEFLAP